jgi:hypothetical protein
MSDVIQPNKGPRLGCMEVAVGLAALLLLISLIVPTFGRVSKRGDITTGISNCRKIITTMRIYSSDHGGGYPDASPTALKSSNEAFRVLFREGLLDDEDIFGCPKSPFVPDGRIGKYPEFQKALESGENHWAITRGLDDSASGSIPLVFENPVVATWPPKWNVDAKGTKTHGRAWSNGIIIGMNDSSVSCQPLQSKRGTEVPLKDLGDGSGQNLFTQHGTDWEIQDVEATPSAK